MLETGKPLLKQAALLKNAESPLLIAISENMCRDVHGNSSHKTELCLEEYTPLKLL
jgi:hypothetical protein